MINVSFCKVLYHKLLMYQRQKGVSHKQNQKILKWFSPVLAIRNIFNNNFDVIIMAIMVVLIILFALFCSDNFRLVKLAAVVVSLN